MLKKLAVVAALAGGLIAVSAPAQAGGRVSLSIGLGLPIGGYFGYGAPAYYSPPAVYAQPPVYYDAPPPAYYDAPPAYYGPPPVVYAPRRYYAPAVVYGPAPVYYGRPGWHRGHVHWDRDGRGHGDRDDRWGGDR